MVCESEPTHSGPERVGESHGETLLNTNWPGLSCPFTQYLKKSITVYLIYAVLFFNAWCLGFFVIVLSVWLCGTIQADPSNASLSLPADQWLTGVFKGWKLLQKPVQLPRHPRPVRGTRKGLGATPAIWSSLIYLAQGPQQSSFQVCCLHQAVWVKLVDLIKKWKKYNAKIKHRI